MLLSSRWQLGFPASVAGNGKLFQTALFAAVGHLVLKVGARFVI
jgi:hypothetical protein